MQFKKYKIFLIIFAIWILLVVLIGLSANLIAKSGLIEDVFAKKLGLGFEFLDLNTNFDAKFNLNINADKIRVLDKNKKTCFITLYNPSITLNPFSFVFNKVNIKKFNSDNILINIKRNNKGEIDLINALDINNLKYKPYKIVKLNSNINNIDFIFEDEYITPSKTRLNTKNSSIMVSKRRNIFHIQQTGTIETSINNCKPQIADFNITVGTNQKSKENKYIYDMNLNNINLYILSDIAKKYISKDIKTINGIANINAKTKDTNKFSLNISNLSMLLNNNKIINPYKEINVTADFTTNKNNLTLNDFKIKSNELDITSKGDISNILSKKPQINLETTINNTQLNNFIPFIPDNLIYYRPQGIPTLKNSNFHGTLNGKVNLSLFPLDITGSVKISDIFIPNYPKPFNQNDATLFFMKDKMRLYSRIYTPDNEYVTIDGISNLDDSLYGKYDIKSTKKIDLHFAQLYLVPIQQIIGFNIGPVPIMDITGYGNIDIKTQGTIEDAQIFGYFSAYNANAIIHGLDAKLTNGECKLIFENRNLIFKELKGNLDGAIFSLSGMGNTKGVVDLRANIKNAYLSNVLKIMSNSVLTEKYLPVLKNISATSGVINSQINLKGTIKNYEKEDFLNSLALSGNAEFKNNKIILNNGMSAKNLNGIFNFDEDKEQTGAFEFYINDSKINTMFELKAGLSKIASGKYFDSNFIINSQKLAFSDVISELKNIKIANLDFRDFAKDAKNINFYTKLSLNTNAKVSINDIDINNFKTKGYIVGLNSNQNKDIKFEQGIIKIENNNLIFNNFKVLFLDGLITANGTSDDNLKISLSNINLSKLDKLIPKTKLQNAILKSGNILVKKDILKLDALNINYSNMPIIINLTSKINTKNPNYEATFSTIVNETTADCVINPHLSYPIKIKGEIPAKGKFSGNFQNYTIDFTTSIPKDSDISFSGANVGDSTQYREITGKIHVDNNILNINNIKLTKFVKNQNNKLNPLPVISLGGKARHNNDTLYYDNLKISTTNPVNVRILNLLFKKSILKKGNFECNISLNGKAQAPKILGKVTLQDLDIPLYDTQINNIKIDFLQNFVDATIQAKNKQSDVEAKIHALNKQDLPYIVNKISINSNKLDIQDILQSVPSQGAKTDISQKQDFQIKPQDIIVKEGNFSFDEVSFENINAQNLKGTFSYKDNLFDLKNIIFNIANGKVDAKGEYSIQTTKLKLRANIHDCDSNILAKNFLNISGQIYGNMTGAIDLTAKNINSPEAIKNLDSKVNFTINNGKMPKLGSLEYLLRAGNILKNGLLGLSLNNLIQVINVYKTGEFEKITGNLDISKGIVKNLEISSKGKNLSMYLFGNYNILENFADIKIYGRLSQNVSSALGAIGNASIKQFLNAFSNKKDTSANKEIQEYLDKVPLVDSSDQGGYFSAIVFGDINKDNYIKKFNWE